MQATPYNHQLNRLPQTYLPGSPVANLNYQTPGFYQPSLPAQLGRSPSSPLLQYPAGLRPGSQRDLLVTSGPGYISPKASYGQEVHKY